MFRRDSLKRKKKNCSIDYAKRCSFLAPSFSPHGTSDFSASSEGGLLRIRSRDAVLVVPFSSLVEQARIKLHTIFTAFVFCDSATTQLFSSFLIKATAQGPWWQRFYVFLTDG